MFGQTKTYKANGLTALVAMTRVQVSVTHGTAQTLYRQRLITLSVMLAFVLTACETTRKNANKKTVRNSALIECRVADRCADANG